MTHEEFEALVEMSVKGRDLTDEEADAITKHIMTCQEKSCVDARKSSDQEVEYIEGWDRQSLGKLLFEMRVDS